MESLFFHPKVVHLPIALSLLMPLVCAGLLLAWMRNLLPRRTWIVAVVLQAFLAGSGFVAMQSGEAEEETVEALVAEARIEAHEEAAEIFTWSAVAALFLFAVALLLPGEALAQKVAMAATAASLVVLFLGYRTGQAGGSLVYEHGAASAYTSSAPGIGQAPGTFADTDDD